MQSLAISSIVKNSVNISLGNFIMNSTRNSFRNLHFQCNSCKIHTGHFIEKRNLMVSTGLCNYEKTNGIEGNNNINSIFNISHTSGVITNYRNLKNSQCLRFFSKSNYNLESAPNNNDKNKLKIDSEKFLIGFTCKKCNNRSYKFISKKSYYEGVVIIRCDKCKNLHLIADHLGWYDSMNKFGTIEDYFKRQQNNSSGKTIIKKNLQQLTKTEQNDVIEFLKEEQKELNEDKK
eukprot:jgi/Orpsp1_1/1188930/evm.model.d7180000068297.1